MKSKTCFKCGASKPLADFYAHPRMADGHLNKCKTCAKRDVQERAHSPEGRAYERARAKLPHRKALMTKITKRWQKRFPERRHAHAALAYALRIGKLVPLPCWTCDSPDSEAHHPDYGRPLDVVWLCSAHHKQLHAGVLVNST